MSHDLQQKRWIVRIISTALYLSIPFFRMNGESILRFDIPSLGLLFFGKTIFIENFFIVLIFIFLLTFLIILITQLYGRIWCGWLCPQTILINFTSFFDRKGRSALSKLLSHIGVFVMSLVIGMSMVFYFVSPYAFFHDLTNGTLDSATSGFVIVLTAITYLNFAFVRYGFCTTICPYSKLQSVMFDDHTLIIAMDPETSYKCVKCNACVTACPVGLDIRQGMDSQCINCGQCITACTKTMAKEHEDVPTLIDYIYGFGNKSKPLRTNVVITGIVTFIFLAGFIYKASTMKPYEFQMYPNPGFMPRYFGDNVINSYKMVVKNLTKDDLTVILKVKDFEDYRLEYKEPAIVAPDKTLKETVFVFIPAKDLEKTPILTLTMQSFGSDLSGKPLESEFSFRRPIRHKGASN